MVKIEAPIKSKGIRKLLRISFLRFSVKFFSPELELVSAINTTPFHLFKKLMAESFIVPFFV